MAASGSENSKQSPLLSQNPLPLSAPQEAQVRDLYYKNVRNKCSEEIKDFAKCATNRTISATWACRRQQLAMNSCMVQHATQRMQDEARREWFANLETRRKEREDEERQRIVREEFNKHWWKRDVEGR